MFHGLFRKSLVVVCLSALLGIGVSYGDSGCTFGFDQDNCSNVSCPSGCSPGGTGTPTSVCQMQGPNCCNCWYEQQFCNTTGTKTACPYKTGSPNGKAWICSQSTCTGPCQTEQGVNGTICLTADLNPFSASPTL